MRVVGAMLSDVGLVRSNNEDSVVFSLPATKIAEPRDLGFAAVADGMGGHAAGEVASALAVEVLRSHYVDCDKPNLAMLAAAFEEANAVILASATRDAAYAGMGTTCTAILFLPGAALIGHVGDSRAYRLRDSALEQLTNDHTVIDEMVRSGAVSEEAARSMPYQNVLMQALGTREQSKPDLFLVPGGVAIGDRYLLCSDGLTNMVDNARIAALLNGKAPYDACKALIDDALANGGQDNISVGVFDIEAPIVTSEDSDSGVDGGEP